MVLLKNYTTIFVDPKNGLSHWDKLDFKERDEWRGIAQLKKRESKYFKKLRKQAGDKDERHTTRIG